MGLKFKTSIDIASQTPIKSPVISGQTICASTCINSNVVCTGNIYLPSNGGINISGSTSIGQYITLTEYGANYLPGTNQGALYTKDCNGCTQLLYRGNAASSYEISTLSGEKPHLNICRAYGSILTQCFYDTFSYYAMLNLSEGTRHCFTTRVAGTSGTFIAVNYYDDQYIEIEATGNTLQSGDVITIVNSDIYSGVYYVEDSDGSFALLETSFNGDDTGRYIRGDSWIVPVSGTYLVQMHIDGYPVSATSSPQYEILLITHTDFTSRTRTLSKRTYNSSTEVVPLISNSLITLAEGWRISVGMANRSTLSNFVISGLSVTILKV